MQNIKSSLFVYLTPRQKSQLLGTLKSYFKKFANLSNNELCVKFLEDEKYYLEINNPHFEFLDEYLENDDFYKDLKKFFEFCEYEKCEKEKLKPYFEHRKELAKLARKKANDYKMSKLKPTQKQLNYYEKISKAHNIKKHDTQNASRLDLRNWIMEIIDEYNK
ncbi:MAG: hypothetical protein IJ877_03320 [Candidatus Gastranaerophilales bacterium]|nr:hypothetical protein [Candidatus Gastranaerophilales bacterium]